MDFRQKYIKYKTKYLNLKNRKMIGGETKLKYYNYGKKQFKFNLRKFVDIKEGTDAIFNGNKMIVITRPGRIYEINLNDQTFTQVHNMNRTEPKFTYEDQEEGLLGIATIDNKFYLSYTIDIKSSGASNNDTEIIKLVVSKWNPKPNNWEKKQNIFELPLTNTYHIGGHIISTPTKKIILGTGDGGPQGDPYNRGQDINTLNAKILQINPKNKKIKILAMGLRNPWLFSLDSQNRLWIGDVGWNTSESIKLMETLDSDRDPKKPEKILEPQIITQGKTLDKIYNFGWSIYEGSVHVPNKPEIPFDSFDHPIWEYPTSDSTGRCILGGHFIDELNIYVFGDYLGFVRAIKFNGYNWECVAEDKLVNGELFYSLAYNGKIIYILTNKQIYTLHLEFDNTTFGI